MSMLKTKVVTIPVQKDGEPENRDAGKSFLLTEMPALKAERWARRAFAAMNRNELNIRGELAKLGMLGFFLVGLQALAGGDMDAVDALMDEMLLQIQIIMSDKVVRPLGGDGDIWELSTLYRLRKELIELHMGFTFAELALNLMAASAGMTLPDSQNTPTSQTSSEA